ncbi:MAG: MarR family transcriptional regulator [Candidatus Wallbacteria bacterium]
MLSDEQIQDFRHSLRFLEREFERQMKSETGCCGVTLAQCHLLLELDILKKTSIKTIAGILELDKSTLSRTIDSLVTENLITRLVLKEDRRITEISLTDKGKKTVQKINKMCNEYYSKLFDEIPDKNHKTIINGIKIFAEAMNIFRKKSSKKNSKCCK